MKKKIIILMAAGAILCAAAGYGLSSILDINGHIYTPGFKIVGDVLEPYSVKTMEGFSTEYIEDKQGRVKSISLKDVIDKAKPITPTSRLLITGEDGLTAEIENSNIEDCHIAFDTENGWEAVNLNHPVSSNIKRIIRIAVVSGEPPDYLGVNIITPEKDIMKITPGEMYSMELRESIRFEGTSSMDKDGVAYSDSIYTTHRYLYLKDLTEVNSNVLVMGDGGGYRLDDGEGFLEVKDNSVDYVCKDGKNSVKKVRGIMVDVPKRSVMDAYYDASHYIDNGQNVMVLYLDGFGYDGYKNAIEKGYAPFLKSLPPADRASTVYSPVTNAGFAAMITGKDPSENGVYSRKQKDLSTPSIFGDMKDRGLKASLIEGNIKILNTEIEPILNADENSNGTIDDEIYNSAMKLVDTDTNYLLVHFHSLDDSGHDFGDLDERTMKTVSKIDSYAKDLVSKWKGKVIITSDHGMHTVVSEGDHGVFSYKDMIVPYIITGGGVK